MEPSVLIVDLDATFAHEVGSLLEAQGVRVHVRDEASLEQMKRLRPSALVLSVEQAKSGTSGFSICSRVRRDKDLRGVAIMLIGHSASADALKRHADTSDRADAYAEKPVDLGDFAERVRQLLRRDLSPEDDAAPVADPAPRGNTIPGPPPLPRANVQRNATSLPVVPPPLPRRAATRDDTKPTSVSSPGEGSTTQDLTWRPRSFDEMLRDRVSTETPGAPTHATPDQRLAFLRAQVKYFETREKAIREAWADAQEAGRALEQIAARAQATLAERDARIAHEAEERAATAEKLAAVEEEFRVFQEEITRIFQTKEAEEQATLASLSATEEENADLRRTVDELHARAEDDRERMHIFQTELEALQAELEVAHETERALADTREELDRVRRRLKDAEALAASREDEMRAAKDELERGILEATEERERAEAQHREEILARDEEIARQAEAAMVETAQLQERWRNEKQEWSVALSSVEETLKGTEADLQKVSGLNARLEKTLREQKDELQSATERIEKVYRDNERLGHELVALEKKRQSGMADLEAALADAIARERAVLENGASLKAALDEKKSALLLLEEQLRSESAARSAAEEAERQTMAALEEERTISNRNAEFLERAKEKIVTLTTEHDAFILEFQAEFDREKSRWTEETATLEATLRLTKEELAASEAKRKDDARRHDVVNQVLSQLVAYADSIRVTKGSERPGRSIPPGAATAGAAARASLVPRDPKEASRQARLAALPSASPAAGTKVAAEPTLQERESKNVGPTKSRKK